MAGQQIRKNLGVTGLATALWILAFPVQASFISQSVDITFSSSLLPTSPVTTSSPISITDPGFELDATTEPFATQNVTVSGEYIDIGPLSISFNLFAGGSEIGSTGFQTTGLGSDATYTLDFGSGNNVLSLFEVASVNDLQLDFDSSLVTGVSIMDEFDIMDHILIFEVGTFGIKDVPDAEDFGLITLFSEPGEMPPVPEIPIPAALPLFLSGLALLGFIARRKTA